VHVKTCIKTRGCALRISDALISGCGAARMALSIIDIASCFSARRMDMK